MENKDWNSIINEADGFILLINKEGICKSFFEGKYLEIIDSVFNNQNKSKSFTWDKTNTTINKE